MERAIIYYAKTGLEATDHFVPKLLEKYCKDNGYEIVAMLSEPASTEGVSFPMKYAIIGLNMEEDVNTIITLSKDMIGATDETVIDTLGKLSEYDIYPYMMRVGKMKVKVSFANNGVSIEEAFKNMLLTV